MYKMNKIHKNILVIISLFIFAFIYNVSFCNYNIGLLDEGFTLNLITRILDGQIPYKDFYCLVTPGSYYIGALVYKLFNNSIISLRILSSVFAACFSIVAYEFVAILSNKKSYGLVSFIIITVCGLSMGSTMSYTIYSYNANLFAIISVLFFLIYMFKENKKVYSLLSGIFLVFSFLNKQTVCLYYSVGYIFSSIIILCFYKEKKDIYIYYFKEAIKPIIIGAVIFLLIFLMTNSTGDMIHNLLILPMSEFGSAKISPPNFFQLFNIGINISYVQTILYYWEILIMLIVIFYLIVYKKKEKKEDIILIIILFIFSICEFQLNRERFSFIKIISTWPMICMMFIILLARNNMKKIISRFFYVLLVCLVVFGISVKYNFISELKENQKNYFPETSVLTSEEVYYRYSSLFSELDKLKITGNDAFIYPMSPLIYNLKDINNPTRQDLVILGNFDNEGLNEIIEKMNSYPIEYLIFDNYWDMDGQKFSDYASILNDYIMENYHVVWSYDERLQILQKNR